MRQNGSWNKLTGEEQTVYSKLTDDEAKNYMVLIDEWDMGEPDAKAVFAMASLKNLISSFKMKLIEADQNKPQLSKAGILLAQFISELRQNGLNDTDIANGFETLNVLTIASLMTLFTKFNPEKP